MVKTHLPSHMDSVREKWRPKHQLLILKCYPRLPKNSAADVSPNGSELSYLLYYASTRRSKLQKVGAFLEKKTASDVSKAQSARVMVTLQILTALLENKVIGSDSAFGLIAPHVLRIIHSVLGTTNDVSLVDACLSTWEVFCKHQDQATLAADYEYRTLYEQIVRQWASYARKESAKRIGQSKTPVSIPDSIRLRRAGLGGIKATLTTDNLSSEVGRQLNHGVPVILGNMYGSDAFSLSHLLTLSKRMEDDEKEKDKNRRQSMATVRTFTGAESTLSDPRAAEGTTQDADALAEEETAAIAVDCLRRVFETDNRAQLRAGTTYVLSFLAKEHQISNEKAAIAMDWTSWSAKLFETITKWTPVSDRFIVLVTATETLARLPLTEETASHHLLLTQLVDDILRSDLNLIGLSVMDVLLGFIQQILRVLQSGNGPVATRGSLGTDEAVRTATNNTTTSGEKQRQGSAITSPTQLVLLSRLKSCISDLATHVYYTDQIADMIATILLRLKPSASVTSPPNPASTAAVIQAPSTAVNGSTSQVSMSRERAGSVSLAGGFFSFDAARQIALESVKEILIVANSSRAQSDDGLAQSRNLVPLIVWEGTQWLLRDPAANVRRAYVDAICTWLSLETRRSDSRAQDSEPSAITRNGNANGSVARRALSNASSKERSSRKARNTFLQLLHLAVYENALQHAASSESDILLLHLLLVSMAPRLGVNAVQSALPMVLTLQEDIGRMTSAIAKVRIGSLVHGYLWQLTEQFEFANDVVGRDVYNEIQRRKQHGLWMYSLGIPPTTLDRIPLPGSTSSTVPKITGDIASHEGLRPFERREALVQKIADGYSSAILSPMPTSPSSPGRHSGPGLDRSGSSYLTAKQMTSSRLPDKVRKNMNMVWTKEECLAAIAAVSPRAPSVSGSHSPSQAQVLSGNHRQLLAGAGGSGSSPRHEPDRLNLHGGSTPSLHQNTATQQFNGPHQPTQSGLIPDALHRRPSQTTFATSAEGHKAMKVDELKRVLAGGANPVALIGRFDADSDSDSMVDVGGEDISDAGSRAPSIRNHSPRIGMSSNKLGKTAMLNDGVPTRRNGSIISGRASVRSSIRAGRGKQDLSALLDGIDLGEQQSRRYGNGRPPY